MKKMILGSVVLSSLATPTSVQKLLEGQFEKAFALTAAEAKSNLAVSPLGVYRFQENVLATEYDGSFSSGKTLPVSLEVIVKNIASPVSCNLTPYRYSEQQEVQYSVQFRIGFQGESGKTEYLYSYAMMASLAQGSSTELVFFSESGTTGCFLDNRVTFGFNSDFSQVQVHVQGLNERIARFGRFGIRDVQKLTDLKGKPLSESLLFVKK